MKKSKILIVDDEEDVIHTLQFRLASAGYETLRAKNGAEALEVIRNQGVDLVLADFMMPEINGLELTRLVKTNPNWLDTKILLFSCNNEPEFRHRAIELGAIDYLSKMDGANSIVSRVYEVLSPQPEDPDSTLPAESPEETALRPQLLVLAQSLSDVLHLAQIEKGLPESTQFAIESACRIAKNILNLAGAVDETEVQIESAEDADLVANETQGPTTS